MSLAPGSYFGKLTEAFLGSVGANDTPAFILTFDITHVARDGQWQEIDHVLRETAFYLTEGAREYSFADLRKLGFNGNFDAPEFSDPLASTGTELDLIHESYQGKTQERIKIAKLKVGREKKPVNADLKRTLAAQWRTAAAGNAKPAGMPPPPPARAAAPAAASAVPQQRTVDDPPF